MSKDDPYHDRKVYHFAALASRLGGVSALCFKKPRAINLKIASWTMRPESTTCSKCRKMLKEQGKLPI